MAEKVKSNEDDIKSITIELLLLLANNITIDDELKIQIALDDFGPLYLIGDSDIFIDKIAIQTTLIWAEDKQLQVAQSLFEISSQFFKINEEKKKKLLNDEIIPVIMSLLTWANDQLAMSKRKGEIEIPQTIGIFNICCVILENLTSLSKIALNIISSCPIPTELIKFLNILRISVAKLIHFKPLINIIECGTVIQKQKMVKIGVIQTLSSFISHHSQNISENISSVIYILIQNCLIFVSSLSNLELSQPSYLDHPLFYLLQQDKSLDLIEHGIHTHNQNEIIIGNAIKSLCILYKYHPFPSSLLQFALSTIKHSIMDKQKMKINVSEELISLLNLSFNQNNHECIMNSEILEILNIRDGTLNLQQLTLIVQILSVLFDQGNSNTRIQIRNIAPLELIQNFVIRKNMVSLNFGYKNEILNIKQNKANEDYERNKLIFKLIVQLTEEDKMDQISKIKNTILIKDNQFILQNSINTWEQIIMIINIIKQINDKELAIGAMLIVREQIHTIFFELIKFWNENEMIYLLISLQQLLETSIDSEILYQIIDLDFCKILHYIIEECNFRKQSIGIKERLVIFITFIAIQGALYSNELESNQFHDIFTKSELKQSIQTVIRNDPKIDIKDIQMQQAVERIRLFAAMGYCCVQKEYYVYETTLNVYSTMFNNALISFIQTMERALTKYQQSKKSGTKIISSQDENQINIISNVFFSFGCLLKKSDNAKLLDNLNQHLMMILSLLHANCKCPFNIAFPPVSISNIVAGSFFVLSQLLTVLSPNMIEIHCTQHNLLGHIIPYIFTNQQLNSISSSESINQINVTSDFHRNRNFALDLLYVLIHDSEQITLQVISNSKLIGEIMKIALGKGINDRNRIEQFQSQFKCLQIINDINKNSTTKNIQQMFYSQKELKLISELISIAGGSGKDNDNVTSTDVEILSALLWKFHEQNDKEEGKQLSNEILEQVEFDGMAEECDVLLYHTDIRQSVGVVDRAFKLWNRLSLRVIP